MDLPKKWTLTPLKNTCDILNSMRVPVNSKERKERISGKSENELFPYYGATGQVDVIDGYLFEGEHVLLGEDGAPFLDPLRDKAYIVDGKFWVNNHAHILKAKGSNKYLSYYLNSIRYESHISGTTRHKLTQRALTSIQVALPPFGEQYRIVAKIEELFSELDKGIESLKTARAQLAVYRQAVLKHAFEGKLTADWRKKNKGKLETPEQLLARIKREREAHYERQLEEWKAAVEAWEEDENSSERPIKPKKLRKLNSHIDDVSAKMPPLPNTSKWEQLGWMTCGVEYGTASKSAKTGKVPVLRMGNIKNAKFDWTDLVYTSSDGEIERYLLKDGDVLFNRTNSPELVGKTAIYRGERPAIFAGYLIRLNHIHSIVDGRYLNLFLNSYTARQHGNSVKTDGVNQSNISGAKLSNYPFPYCSIEEQREIAGILDKVFSVLDETETNLIQELENADALRQSILKKAFSGQLVPQDPNDEPASVLLERIRAEKMAQSKGKTAKKRQPKAATV